MGIAALKQGTKLLASIVLLVAGFALVTNNCQAYQSTAARAVTKLPAGNTKTDSQSKAPVAKDDWTAEFKKNPELWIELGKLISRMQDEVKFPAMRRQSQILPRLADSTDIYAAFPNYGEALHQGHLIFKQQLKDSPALQEALKKSEGGKSDPKLDDVLDQVYLFSQYLGDEIVACGSYKGKTGFLIAEVKKPGLEKFLPEMYKTLNGKSGGNFQVITPQQLAGAKSGGVNEAVALVRADFVLVGSDLEAIRAMNVQLDSGKKSFVSTAFGQRMKQAYVDGISTVVGVNLQPMIPDFTKKQSDRELLQASGFADMKYAVWEMKDHNGGAELSFTSPRHGIASWLGNAAPLGGLDFLSPSATTAGAILLKSPAQIFDDYRDLADKMNPASLKTLAQMQMALGIDLRNDLLNKLDGEIAYEIDGPIASTAEPIDKKIALSKPATPPAPAWRLALHVNDPVGLQQTFTKLLTAAHVEVKHLGEGKFTVHSFPLPAGPEPLQISYTFADGYLLVGSNRGELSEALRVHQTGASLAKSAKLRAALPDNQALIASGLVYQNMGSFLATIVKQLPAEFAQTLPQLSGELQPSVSAIYGSERAIKGSGGSSATGAGVVMVVAAIAIPNLLRSRIAANEAAAGATIRTVNTAQVVYATTYPAKGYSRNLASLGPGASGECDNKSITENHACLLDGVLGNAGCMAGSWCKKGSYNYSVSATCRTRACEGYVAVATPVSSDVGARSFCSIEDAVIRSLTGPPLATPVSAAECRRWAPVR